MRVEAVKIGDLLWHSNEDIRGRYQSHRILFREAIRELKAHIPNIEAMIDADEMPYEFGWFLREECKFTPLEEEQQAWRKKDYNDAVKAEGLPIL